MTCQLNKRKQEFALVLPFLFWSGPQWIGWCPPLLVRGIFFTQFTDSIANVSWVCLCECFTSSLGILSPVKLTHEINHHNQINPESDDSFASNLLCNFGQFSCLLYASKSLTLKCIVINLIGSYASQSFLCFGKWRERWYLFQSLDWRAAACGPRQVVWAFWLPGGQWRSVSKHMCTDSRPWLRSCTERAW